MAKLVSKVTAVPSICWEGPESALALDPQKLGGGVEEEGSWWGGAMEEVQGRVPACYR